mgnify:CR=1 FL=1
MTEHDNSIGNHLHYVLRHESPERLSADSPVFVDAKRQLLDIAKTMLPVLFEARPTASPVSLANSAVEHANALLEAVEHESTVALDRAKHSREGRSQFMPVIRQRPIHPFHDQLTSRHREQLVERQSQARHPESQTD